MEHARPARTADAPRLRQLCDEAVAELSARRGGPQMIAAVLHGRSAGDALDAAMADANALVVAGSLHGAVLGIGVVRTDPPAARSPATVDVLYVESAARSVGLGEAIMELMAAWATERGCTGIDAGALPGSREAKAFFETHGMVTRALVMHRPLGPVSG